MKDKERNFFIFEFLIVNNLLSIIIYSYQEMYTNEEKTNIIVESIFFLKFFL